MGAKFVKFFQVFTSAPSIPTPMPDVDIDQKSTPLPMSNGDIDQKSTPISVPDVDSKEKLPQLAVTISPPAVKSAETLRKEAKDELGIDTNLLNFAFVGASGVGKSSLINAISGRNSMDPSNAPVGVTETTHEIKQYKDPRFAHITYWDLPGGGTVRHPADNYWEAKKLYAFDHLLIVGATRFLDFDIKIAKTAIANKEPVFFIRTKLDIDIQNQIDDSNSPPEEIEKVKKGMKEQVLKSMKTQLEAENITNPPIYRCILSQHFVTRLQSGIRQWVQNVKPANQRNCC